MTTAAQPRPVAPPTGRVADARVWLGEFFAADDGGGIRLAENGPEGWSEFARGIWHGPTFTARGLDRSAMLDALAAALVTEADDGRDVFACPYPHAGPRRQAAAVARRHVHADVDGPVDLSRVREVGGMAVASGSVDDDGRPHGHVYVRLSESVPPEAHAALCAAVGRFVGREHHDPSKVGDADVLRPAGTLNHKRGAAAPVRWLIAPDAPEVRTWAPEALAGLLGVVWPQTAAVDEDEAEVVERCRPPLGADEVPRGSLAARFDGLAREVTEADPGRGNAVLNWAAGVAAALWATETDRRDAEAEQVRADLVAAYMGRPVPLGESAASREREARRTVASGWRWGVAHPARALTRADDERPDHPETDPEDVTVTDRETEANRAEGEVGSSTATDLAESATDRRQRLAESIARARDTEYARLVGRGEGRSLWEADLAALVEADPGRVLADARARFRLYDRDEVVAMPDPVDVVAGLVPPLGEIGELSGSRGLGKSLLSLDLAGHVAAQSEHAHVFAGDRRVNVHGPVLYVAREGWQGFTKRVRAWERFGWPVPGSVESLRPPRRMEGVTFTPSGIDLRKAEDAHGLGMLARALGAVLVILDSAQGTGMGAEDTADTARFNAGVRAVRDASGAAVLVLHNSGWDDSRGRGSTLLPDIAGSVLHLSGDPKGLRVLKDQKYRDGSAGDALGFTFHPVVVGQDPAGGDVVSGLLVPADLPSAMVADAAETQARYLRAIDAAPGASTGEVAEFVGESKDAARRTLARLAADGVGLVVNRGKANRNAWHLTDKGREAMHEDGVRS